MKITREQLWSGDAEAQYARHLASSSASISANQPRGKHGATTLWATGDQTLCLVLSTAFNLQPRRWSFGVTDTGDSQ